MRKQRKQFEGIDFGQEHGMRVTSCVLTWMNLPANVGGWTDEPLELSQELGEPEAEEDRDAKTTDEAFPGFVG